MERLKTWIHISDLHIGDIDLQTGTSTDDFDAAARTWWQMHQRLDGFLGHNAAALRALDDFVADLERKENAELIVTGDLTAYGSDTQLELAQDYLTSSIPIPMPVGLSDPAIFDRTIPGNHDHWPGVFFPPGIAWMFGPEVARFHTTFQPTPDHVIHQLGGGTTLMLARIDSDAGVGPYSFDRLFARGVFEDQLNHLASTLPKRKDKEVRVLLIHHSYAYRSGGRCGILQINNSDSQALRNFVVDHEFDVMLSGHCHRTALEQHDLTSDSGSRRMVYEARCGTTTQISEPPPNWNQSNSYTNRFPRNTLLIHRLFHNPATGNHRWETAEYVRNRGRFVPNSRHQTHTI